MSRWLERVVDGAGQKLRVGDRVAGVRVEPRVHTLVGRVKRLTPTTAVIDVTWVSEPDPGLREPALRRRAQVGECTRVGLTRVFRLSHSAEAGDGLTEGAGESVLDRDLVQLRYAAALDRVVPGFVEDAEEIRPVAWGLAEVVLRVRDRELALLRQRLSLRSENLSETGEKPETATGERGVDRKRALQLTQLLDLDAGVTWMDTVMAVVKLKVTAARVNSAEREAATLRGWTRVARYAVGANVAPDRLEALADWLDQLDKLRAVPGARPGDEVQRDLRTWASLMRDAACDEITRLGEEMETETGTDVREDRGARG